MSAAIRFIGLLAVACLVSIALVLLITSAGRPSMSDLEVTARWTVLLAQKTPVAVLLREVMGSDAPLWARRFAVMWHKTNMLSYWWVPLVVIGVRYLAARNAWKRSRP